MATSRCWYCGQFFRPIPQKGRKQKCCGRAPCRQVHQRRKYQSWIKRHPDYRKTPDQRNKAKDWAKTYPDYWQHYRRSHPSYVRRDNRRRRQALRLTLMSAKQTEWRHITVDKLRTVKAYEAKNSAKQTVCDPRVEALIDVLIWREASAKQNCIDLGA